MIGDTNSATKHTAHVRGIVEVICTMRGTDAQARVRVANVCKEAVLNFQTASSGSVRLDGGITGELEVYNTEGYFMVKGPFVQVLDREQRPVSSQMAQDISTIVALRDSNGLLVIIGKCQLRNKRVAVVLDMFSDQRADLVIDDYQKFKDRRVVGVVYPQPHSPHERPLPLPTPPKPQSQRPTWPPVNDNGVEEKGVSVKNLQARFMANSADSPAVAPVVFAHAADIPPPPPTTPKPNLQEFVPMNYNKPGAPTFPPQTKPLPSVLPQVPPKPSEPIHDINSMRRGSLDMVIPNQQRRPSLPGPGPTQPTSGTPPAPPIKFNPILPQRSPDDPVPAPPGTIFPGSNINNVPAMYDEPTEEIAQEYYTDPDHITQPRTYMQVPPDFEPSRTPVPSTFVNNYPATHSPAVDPQALMFSKQDVPPPPPRPQKSKNAMAKLAQFQRQQMLRNRTESVESEETATGSYDFQNQTMTEDIEVLSSPQAIYGDIHQPSKTIAQQDNILSPRGYIAEIKKAVKKFGNVALQSPVQKNCDENKQQDNAIGRYDFQVPDPSDDDDIPVLRHYRPLPPISPGPVTTEASRLSVSSDSSGQSESMEEPEYVVQETYYGCLGISVEDSERIYMKRPIRRTNRYSKPPQSLAEDIICFVLEDTKHLQKLERINKAREEMSPMLQNLLRKTQSLSKVHLKMNSELKNFTDSCSKIAHLLLRYKEQLETYIYYVTKAPEINNLLNDLSEDFLRKYPGIKDDIRSSWKRFNFYILTLEQFQKNAPEGDKPTIAEALEMLRDLSKRADTEILLDGIKGAPYPLHTLGILLLHSSFNVTGPLLKKDYTIRVLLFPKTIVITQHKNNKYDFLLDIPVTQSYFAPMKQENAKSFALEVNLGGIQGKKQYVFQAPNKDVKEAWVSEILSIMREFAEAEKKEQAKRNAT